MCDLSNSKATYIGYNMLLDNTVQDKWLGNLWSGIGITFCVRVELLPTCYLSGAADA